MHPALDHITRWERDPERWNYAGDTVINQCLLTKALVLSLMVVLWTEIYSNKVVALLMVSTTCCHHNNGGGGYGNEGQGKPFDELQPYEGSPAEVEQLKSSGKSR